MADYSNSKPNLGSVFPYGAQDAQEWSRVEPLITPEQLRRRQLLGIPLVSFMPDPITKQRMVVQDEDLKDSILRAVSKIELETGLTIMPVQYTEKQPWDYGWWDAFGYIKVERRPIMSVEKVAFTPASGSDVVVLDPTWIDPGNFHKGQINVVPLLPANSSGMVTATTGIGGAAFIMIFYGKSWVPSLINVHYTCGFDSGKIPRVLNELIGCEAAIDILTSLTATMSIQSYSLAIDSTSQSVSTAGPGAFQPKIDQLMERKKLLSGKLKNLYGMGIQTSYV